MTTGSKVGVVGPCAAGKSTLVTGLKARGIFARHIAQEHSYVADMWKRLVNPDVLIYLDVSYAETIRRRKLDWSVEEYNEQLNRLRNARQMADLYIYTDVYKIVEVLEKVLSFLETRKIA